jgi:hypothetical protein
MSEATSTTELHGGCLCGAVRYTVSGQPQSFYHCHCKRCRKASGTGHASNLFVLGSIEWQQGEEQIRLFILPEAKRFSNSFCATCGGRVPRFIEQAGIVMIPAGSLDDEPSIKPMARIFSDSKASWSCDQAEIPTFEKYPPRT